VCEEKRAASKLTFVGLEPALFAMPMFSGGFGRIMTYLLQYSDKYHLVIEAFYYVYYNIDTKVRISTGNRNIYRN